MSERGSGFLGVVAVGAGVCCGLPILVSVGVVGAAAGLGLGSWILLAAGAAVAALGVHRRRSRGHAPVNSSVDDVTEAPRSVS